MILEIKIFLQLPPVSSLCMLRQLEVSYNEIRSMQGISELPNSSLKELFCASNKIKTIEVALPTDISSIIAYTRVW